MSRLGNAGEKNQQSESGQTLLVEAVVTDCAPDLPAAPLANYPDFPDN